MIRTKPFKPTDYQGNYVRRLTRLRLGPVSGVYAIVDAKSGSILYVGESHTGRLYDTITRHFRAWKVKPDRSGQGRRQGGTMYNRESVKVAYVICPADKAQEYQYAEIQRLRPRDNEVDCTSEKCAIRPQVARASKGHRDHSETVNTEGGEGIPF